MLYRIDRLHPNGEYSYEYVCGKRKLGERCCEIAHTDMEIFYIAKLICSRRTLKACLTHTISDHKNVTI